MSLIINQTDRRSELQAKIDADLRNRTNINGLGNAPKQSDSVILKDTKQSTGRTLFWAGAAAMLVIAVVVFVIFFFEG